MNCKYPLDYRLVGTAIPGKLAAALANRCGDCGTEYRPEDETRIGGQPLGLCPACAEDYLSPRGNFEGWED